MGSRCWRPNETAFFEHRKLSIPLDVDVSSEGHRHAYEEHRHVLRNLTTGAVRTLPAEFPIDFSTRLLPDGRVRTIRRHGYHELRLDGSVVDVYEPGRDAWEPRSIDVGEEDFGRTVWGVVLPLRAPFD